MNKLNIIGRITHDIELRKTTSGTSVVQIDIAVRRNFKNSNNEYETDFFNVDAYGNNAEFIAKYFHKGDPIGIVARLQNANYEKDGKTVYKNAIIVEETTLMGAKKSTTEETTPEEPVENEYEGFTGQIELTDDDLPF